MVGGQKKNSVGRLVQSNGSSIDLKHELEELKKSLLAELVRLLGVAEAARVAQTIFPKEDIPLYIPDNLSAIDANVTIQTTETIGNNIQTAAEALKNAKKDKENGN